MRASTMQGAAPATLVWLCFVTAASASVMGDLKMSSGNGTTTVTLSSITFNSNSTGNPSTGPWNAEVANTTTLIFAGCSSGLGTTGCLSSGEAVELANNNTIVLSAGFGANNPFIQFGGNGTTHTSILYTIAAFGSASSNTNCQALMNYGDSCSVFAGSPILLTLTAAGTNAALTAIGTVTDGSGVSNWIGQLVTPITGMTPYQVQQYFCPSGTCLPADFTSGRSITEPFAGDFLATAAAVPEPGTAALMLIGGGLIAFASVRNRRRR